LIQSVNEDASTMRRLVAHYEEFKAMNHIQRPDIALFAFIVDIGLQGLKPSTCKSYVKLVLEGKSREGSRIVGPLVSDIFKVLNLMEAEGDSAHAIDVEMPVLESILWALPPGRLRLTFFLLLYVGCRAADGVRLSSGAFRVDTDGNLLVHFRITKNRRRKAEAFTVRVRPPRMIPELIELIRAEDHAPCPTLPCDLFNQQIKTAAGYVEGMTSYTLRRAFIQQVIKEKTVGDTTAWLEVARLTGHHSLEILRTHYTASIFNTTL
jgi:hypothetical protein